MLNKYSELGYSAVKGFLIGGKLAFSGLLYGYKSVGMNIKYALVTFVHNYENPAGYVQLAVLEKPKVMHRTFALVHADDLAGHSVYDDLIFYGVFLFLSGV